MKKELTLLQNFQESGESHCRLVIAPDYMKTLGPSGSCKVKIKTGIDQEVCVNFSTFFEYIKNMDNPILSVTDKKLIIKSGRMKGSLSLVNKPSYYDQPFNPSGEIVSFNTKQFIDYSKALLRYCHNSVGFGSTFGIRYDVGSKSYLYATDTFRLVQKSIDASGDSSFIVAPKDVNTLTLVADYVGGDSFEFIKGRGIFIQNEKIDMQLVNFDGQLPSYSGFIDGFKPELSLLLNKTELLKGLAISDVGIGKDYKGIIDVIVTPSGCNIKSIDAGSENDVFVNGSSTGEITMKITSKYLKEMAQICNKEDVGFDVNHKKRIRYERDGLMFLFACREI